MFQHRTPINRLLNMKLLAGSKAVEATATGNPLTFSTDIARPLKSLLIPFTPVQSGTGDPSPQNIRSILPWNGLKVWNGGKNLLDPSTLEQGGINTDGLAVSNPKRIRTGYIPVKENTYYCLSAGEAYKAFLHFYDKDKGSIGGNTIAKSKATAGACYVRGIIGYQEETNIVPADCTTGQIEVVAQSGQATEYVPYKPITETDISFPSPVYGGEHEAVSGKLMDGWKVETLDDSDAWTDGGTFISYSNHAFTDRKVGDSFIGVCSALPIKNNVPSGTAYMRWGGTDAPNILIAPNGSGLTLEDVKTLSGQGKIVLAYPLATPQEITLTPEQITALVGDNTIWSDADGSMTAVYLKKG